MQKINEYQEKLNKIEKNCSLCHAKLCNMCPNNKTKKILRKKLNLKEESFFKKVLNLIKSS